MLLIGDNVDLSLPAPFLQQILGQAKLSDILVPTDFFCLERWDVNIDWNDNLPHISQ